MRGIILLVMTERKSINNDSFSNITAASNVIILKLNRENDTDIIIFVVLIN